MTPELAQAALQFMQRVQLQGQEVPAFNAVCHALLNIAQKPAEEQTARERVSAE